MRRGLSSSGRTFLQFSIWGKGCNSEVFWGEIVFLQSGKSLAWMLLLRGALFSDIFWCLTPGKQCCFPVFFFPGIPESRLGLMVWFWPEAPQQWCQHSWGRRVLGERREWAWGQLQAGIRDDSRGSSGGFGSVGPRGMWGAGWGFVGEGCEQEGLCEDPQGLVWGAGRAAALLRLNLHMGMETSHGFRWSHSDLAQENLGSGKSD